MAGSPLASIPSQTGYGSRKVRLCVLSGASAKSPRASSCSALLVLGSEEGGGGRGSEDDPVPGNTETPVVTCPRYPCPRPHGLARQDRGAREGLASSPGRSLVFPTPGVFLAKVQYGRGLDWSGWLKNIIMMPPTLHSSPDTLSSIYILHSTTPRFTTLRLAVPISSTETDRHIRSSILPTTVDSFLLLGLLRQASSRHINFILTSVVHQQPAPASTPPTRLPPTSYISSAPLPPAAFYLLSQIYLNQPQVAGPC